MILAIGLALTCIGLPLAISQRRIGWIVIAYIGTLLWGSQGDPIIGVFATLVMIAEACIACRIIRSN